MSGLFSSTLATPAARRPDDEEQEAELPQGTSSDGPPPDVNGSDAPGYRAPVSITTVPLEDISPTADTPSEAAVPVQQPRVSDGKIRQENSGYDNEEQLKEAIKLHEGFRDEVYNDTKTHPTIGYGHELTGKDGFQSGVKYDEKYLSDIFEKDFQGAKQDTNDILKYKNIDDNSIDKVAKSILTEMVFNMGKSKILKFKDMLDALAKQDYAGAADEMLNSKWHRDKDTADRSAEMAKVMRSLSRK